jgi:hypothetical protein
VFINGWITEMSDNNQWDDDSFKKSWLGRVLSGEEKIDFDTTERPEYPKFAESVHMDESGKLTVRSSWYGLDGGKTIGNDVCEDPESAGYKEVLSRHPGLAPGRSSGYEEYHDGRWQLFRAGEVIASGRKGISDPDTKRQSA